MSKRTSLNKVNTESVFAKNSVSKISRTLYYRTQNHKTTFDAGRLIPVWVSNVIPGDNFKCSFSCMIKTDSPFVKPVMDNLVLDVYAFFTPYRLLDKHFEEIYGNYKPNSDYSEDVNLLLSQIRVPAGGYSVCSVADYLDFCSGVGPGENQSGDLFNHLWFRAYVKNWDEWFRPQFLVASIWNELIPESGIVDGMNENDSDYDDWRISAIRGGKTCPVAKTKDYFTTSLPFPQVGEGEFINLGSLAPVVGYAPLSVVRPLDDEVTDQTYMLGGNLRLAHYSPTPDTIYPYANFGVLYNGLYAQNQDVTNRGILGFKENESGVSSDSIGATINSANLVVDTSDNSYNRSQINEGARLAADLSKVSGISIRELRWVFQAQLIKELDLYGNRLFEVIQNHFGVVASDTRFQRSEFLGHKKFTMSTYQVVQSVSGSGEGASPLGTLASYLNFRCDNEFLFNKSFPEPGVVIVYACVRIKSHTYSQSINRFYRVKSRLQFPWPALTTVGDQPVYTQELYAGASFDDIWGYQTRYSEEKFMNSRVSGRMRPKGDKTSIGDLYSFADVYAEKPFLSVDWIWEDKKLIDRCLAVDSDVSGSQFIAWFNFKCDSIRMSMSGIPGLVDHSHRSIW